MEGAVFIPLLCLRFCKADFCIAERIGTVTSGMKFFAV